MTRDMDDFGYGTDEMLDWYLAQWRADAPINSIDNREIGGMVNTMTTPQIKTDRDHRYYATGYQNALQEILEIAETEGADAALRYARENRAVR